MEPETLAVKTDHVFPFESEMEAVPPLSIETPRTRRVAPEVSIAAVVTESAVPTPDCEETSAMAIAKLYYPFALFQFI